MARKKRTVADREKSLQTVTPDASVTLAGARAMYTAVGGEEFPCTINGHCRTQIFEFPRIDLRPNGDDSHHCIYDSPSVQSCVTSNLIGYFAKTVGHKHYRISPCLQHVVRETDRKIRSQQSSVPVYLVIEQNYALTPVEMNRGECSISDEVIVRDDEKIPALVGGRENRKFITAWATVDGSWPKLSSRQQIVNLILAGVRVAQKTSDPIKKHVDQSCLVTDDGAFAVMMQSSASARLQSAMEMDAGKYRSTAAEIRKAIVAMERDVATPHLSLLINSMYCDEHKDDPYKRLQYLRLWQSLVEAGAKYLGYGGNIRKDNVVVAGKKTLQELTEYRNDIAHWWTDNIDENFLADLQRTINELIRRKYF